MSKISLTQMGASVAALLLAAAPALAENDAAGNGDEAPFLIQWSPGEFIWTLVLFLILLVVLVKYVWPPILNGLKDREDKIRMDLANAEQARREADEALEQYKAQLAESRKEAQQIIEQSRADAQKVAAELKGQAQQEIEQMRTRAQHEIRAAQEQAIAEVYARTAELATHIAGRILQREINAEDQKALIDSSLNELAQHSVAETGVGGQA